MLIKLWGVRGSIPTPLDTGEYRDKLRGVLRHALDAGLNADSDINQFIEELPPHLGRVFGGDTTCVCVEPSVDEAPVIIDCGTGLRRLGDALMEGPCGRGEGIVRICFTHTHHDHIQGLPFFKPLYIPGNEIHFYSPLADLEARLVRQQIDHYFPMPFENTASRKYFYVLNEKQPLELDDGTQIDFQPLKHPGGSFAYRFRRGGASFIFATDVEFTGEDMLRMDATHPFFGRADLLVMDAQYTLDDHFSRFDWGHTSVTMAVNCAARWDVKTLVLTHHEPSYSDARLMKNLQLAIEHKGNMNATRPQLHLARQGMQFRVGPEK
ncbi:MAG: MBL fold metallo-hydrolase [Leptospiraceae bacterium]|nr:MBL fold metallo-hydrolase [Leptospiraceae bacterium]MCB1314335.1 MBL fold metallo-hydrolase [Leptospiraceae bacterium]MCB1320499.1 MBL fold metallo-hydrolase [Leptospiraceae bacterium]